MAERAIPKPKPAGKGFKGKLNAEYGVGPLKLPLWGWGAVAIGAWWLYHTVIKPSQAATDTTATDGTDGIGGPAGAGDVGGAGGGGGTDGTTGTTGSSGSTSGHTHCPKGHHYDAANKRCVPNKKHPPHHHPHPHGTKGSGTHAHPHMHAGSHVHHHDKRVPPTGGGSRKHNRGAPPTPEPGHRAPVLPSGSHVPIGQSPPIEPIRRHYRPPVRTGRVPQRKR